MSHPSLARAFTSTALAISSCALAACSTTDAPPRRAASSTVIPQTSGSAPEETGKPAAMVDGVTVDWSVLRPLLAEASGGAALQEVILDRRLEKLMVAQGVTLEGGEQAAMARERALFIRTLIQTERARPGIPAVTPDEAEVLLANIRRTRGLGDVRFTALLLRTARLRALVQSEVQLDDASLQQAINIRYGPKHRCRIIVTATTMDAANARQRIVQTTGLGTGTAVPGALTAAFAAEAMQTSIDPSARPAGGQIEPFNVNDLTYPAAIRQVAANLPPGTLSPVIALDRNYAILLVESIDPAAPQLAGGAVPATIRDEVERDLRARLERVRMDSLVTRTLAAGGITVLDRSLAFSYEGLSKPR